MARISSSASSFCEVMMYATQRFASTIAVTFSTPMPLSSSSFSRTIGS